MTIERASIQEALRLIEEGQWSSVFRAANILRVELGKANAAAVGKPRLVEAPHRVPPAPVVPVLREPSDTEILDFIQSGGTGKPLPRNAVPLRTLIKQVMTSAGIKIKPDAPADTQLIDYLAQTNGAEPQGPCKFRELVSATMNREVVQLDAPEVEAMKREILAQASKKEPPKTRTMSAREKA